ncbi:MAG: TRAP transporter small permease [Burkholderiaceae bacterium]
MIEWLRRFAVGLSAVALAAVFVLVVMQVVLRYGFGITPYFTTEIARFAMVWSVLAGAAASVAPGQHIAVSFLSEILPARVQAGIDRGFDLLAAVLFGVLTWASVQSVGAVVGQTSDGLQIPLAGPYAMLPAAFGAALVFALRRLLRGAPRTQ